MNGSDKLKVGSRVKWKAQNALAGEGDPYRYGVFLFDADTDPYQKPMGLVVKENGVKVYLAKDRLERITEEDWKNKRRRKK